MAKEKYIIVEVRGHPVAVLFDSLIEHSAFLECFNVSQILSAGYFQISVSSSKVKDKFLVVQNISVTVFGESVSLNRHSREEDRNLIKKVLT